MPVDFSRLQTLLIGASEQLQQVRGKELVLVIGRTGAGKSTLINYLQGYNFQSTRDRRTGKTNLEQLPLSNPPSRSPIIGHGTESCTLYPDVYHLSGETYVCDTAGFGDNRGETIGLFSFLAVQMAINAAGHIKAVIAVVEETQLDAGRGEAFMEIAQTLSSMFRGSEYNTSLFMVFNKGTRTNEQLLATMDDMMTEQAGIARNTAKAQEARQAASSVQAVLSMFLKNKRVVGGVLGVGGTPNYDECRNVMALVPTAQECRQLLSSLIGAARPIPRESLGIAMDTTNRNDLERILCNIATDGRRWIRDKQTAEETLASKTDELNRITADKQREETQLQEVTLMLRSRFFLKNMATQHYLDCGTKSDGHGEIYGRSNAASGDRSNGPESNNSHQEWLLESSRSGRDLFFLRNMATQHYLDCAMKSDRHGNVYGRNDAATGRGTNGPASAPHPAQEWLLEPSRSGRDLFFLRNTATQHYLDCAMKSDRHGCVYGRGDAATGRGTNGPASAPHPAQEWLLELSRNRKAQLEQTKSILEANIRNKTSNIQGLNTEISNLREIKQRSEAYLSSTENKQRFKMLFIISEIMNMAGEDIVEFKRLYNVLPTTLRFAEVSQGQSGLHFQYSSSSSNQPIVQTVVPVASFNQLSI